VKLPLTALLLILPSILVDNATKVVMNVLPNNMIHVQHALQDLHSSSTMAQMVQEGVSVALTLGGPKT
jgi:uncharacterized membrane protein